jgi:hypothetical protein
VGTVLAALIFFHLVYGIDTSLRHLWISLMWPTAKAELLQVALPGHRPGGFRSPKGLRYDVVVSVRTTDGRAFAGRMMEPLVDSSLEPVPPGASRPPPRPGNLITVHLHPSGDGRVMPRDNLHALGGPLLLIAVLILITALNIAFPRWPLGGARHEPILGRSSNSDRQSGQ